MMGLEESNATVRWTVAADGVTEANKYLLSSRAEVNESHLSHHEQAVFVYLTNAAFFKLSAPSGTID